MRKFYFIYCVLFVSTAGFSQAVKTKISAPYIGLGAYSIKHANIFSVTSNQASLAQIKNPSAGVFGENRFLMTETNMYSAIIAVPTKDGNFAFQADYFGFKNYNESQLGIAYARSVGKNLDLGIKFNYYAFRIPRYENPSTVTFEIGAIAHVTEKLNAGIHIYNPVGGKFSKTENDKLGSIYSFGLGYDVSEIFNITGEIVKQEDVPVNVNVAMQYNFARQFFAQFGIATQNSSPFGGAGISWDNFRLDICASYHPQFGISPGLMFIVDIKKQKIEEEKKL